jgi:hypothetical protein
MTFFILRLIGEWLSYTFKPCPRLKAGYNCHKYRSGGCPDCGRGS